MCGYCVHERYKTIFESVALITFIIYFVQYAITADHSFNASGLATAGAEFRHVVLVFGNRADVVTAGVALSPNFLLFLPN